ncbi:MAG: type III glutamate--ammonia ligase, partial [Cyanobacteria bacterium J06560_2]
MAYPKIKPLSSDLLTLQKKLQEQGVKYAMASFVDIHGMCKGKVVPMSHFDRMMQGSELFTGAALDGVPQEINDDEVGTMPDPNSVTILPWNSEIAWFASDLHLVGEPFEACCRTILKNTLKQAEEMGYRFNLGIETEFFIFNLKIKNS